MHHRSPGSHDCFPVRNSEVKAGESQWNATVASHPFPISATAAAIPSSPQRRPVCSTPPPYASRLTQSRRRQGRPAQATSLRRKTIDGKTLAPSRVLTTPLHALVSGVFLRPRPISPITSPMWGSVGNICRYESKHYFLAHASLRSPRRTATVSRLDAPALLRLSSCERQHWGGSSLPHGGSQPPVPSARGLPTRSWLHLLP